MPQDATCPACQVPVPVVEARAAFTVACPRCDAEMTVEFKKPAVPPAPGQPPYDLLVRPGAVAGPAPAPQMSTAGAAGAVAASNSGAALIVGLSTAFGLAAVIGGLGLTAWVLFVLIGAPPSSLDNGGQRMVSAPPSTVFVPSTPAPFTPSIRPGAPNPLPSSPNSGRPSSPESGRPRPPVTLSPVPPTRPDNEFELRPVGGKAPPVTPPPIDLRVPHAVLLPGPAGAVSVGGNGRYIVAHVPTKRQLVCFDVSTGQLNFAPTLTEAGPHQIAGGLDRVAVFAPGNTLRVYDLPDLQHRYDSSGPPMVHAPTSIAMGSATNGPLLICNPFGEVVLVEIGDTAAVPLKGSGGKIDGDLATPVRAAASGTLFVRGNVSNDSKTVLVTETARKWATARTEVCNGYPSADGNYVLGYGMIGRAGGPIVGRWGSGPGAGMCYVPAVSGAHFLRLSEVNRTSKQAVVSVHNNYQSPDTGNVVKLGVLPETEGLVEWFHNRTVPLDQHLFLVPDAKVLVVLNARREQLTVRKVDIR